MPARKPDDRLDSILDSALARCANVHAPAGLEERILAKLAWKKARFNRGAQTAAFVLMAGLLLSALLFRPVNSASIPAKRSDPIIHATVQLLETRESNSEVAATQTLSAAEPLPAMLTTMEENSEPEWTDDDSFISDLEMESLSMATLHVSEMSDSR